MAEEKKEKFDKKIKPLQGLQRFFAYATVKLPIHISFLALFEKENYNVLCGGAKWTI